MLFVSKVARLHTALMSLRLRTANIEETARLVPGWGALEVRRPVDRTNTGPFMGWPTQ